MQTITGEREVLVALPLLTQREINKSHQDAMDNLKYVHLLEVQRMLGVIQSRFGFTLAQAEELLGKLAMFVVASSLQVSE